MKNLILFQNKIYNLTKFHYKNSLNYRNIINNLNFTNFKKEISSIPFLPAKLFKTLTLKSIPDNMSSIPLIETPLALRNLEGIASRGSP